ncbi:MAG: hypothetical protein AB7Q37_03840 [Pyrinomonadaceae bacterium]
MRTIVLLLGFLAVVATILIAWRLLRPNEPAPQFDNANSNESPEEVRSENPYLELRSMALNMPADQFGVESNSKTAIPYGLVVDWNVGRGNVTFVAFSSGDASMYFSSGGGMIGGIGRENVKATAQSLVKESEKFVSKAIRSDDTQMPQAGGVKFFFLTNQGRFVAEESLENFDNGTSELLELFVEANKLITELRLVDELNQK